MFARLLIILALLASSVAIAQNTPNPDFYYGSVIESFHKHDPQMVHFSLLYKGQASDELDVILVRGGRFRDGWRSPKTVAYFDGGDLLGVFLVNRTQPSLAYELTIDGGINQGYEAHVEVERATPGEVTIFGGSASRRKYAYDPGSKQLLWQRDFAADGLRQLTAKDGSFVIWGSIRQLGRGPGTPTVVAVAPAADGFRPLADTGSLPARANTESGLVDLGGGSSCSIYTDPLLGNVAARLVQCVVDGEPQTFHPPQADFKRFAAARPERVSNGYTEENSTFNETIGPYQFDAQRLWFGLTFYDGEGWTGVGALGAFDVQTRTFAMHYLPEMANWSVSALLVEPDAVWLGLVLNGEGPPYSGGLVRWDRTLVSGYK
ncbi:MAG: hypothetical protein O2795_19995 [Acidobacteria bacterium]|nr:hypothetical protein [Acidobacteriota bacterium]